jgi:hypothetical protein
MLDTLETLDKLTDWKNEPTIQDLKSDFDGASIHQQKYITKIKEWEDSKNLEGAYKPKKVLGKSSLQPKVIRKQNEWRYPSLSEPFLSIDNMFKCKPVTFEDVKSARKNELILNHQFNNVIDKVDFIDEYVRRNVDQGLCIIKPYWIRITEQVDKIIPIYQYREPNSQEELDRLQQLIELSNSNPNEFMNLPEELQESVKYYLENNIPVIAEQYGEETVKEEVIIENKPAIDIISPYNFYIDPTCKGKYENANFIVITFESSKADLLKTGIYTNLDKIDFNSSNVNVDLYHEQGYDTHTFNFKDESRKRVVVYEYWGKYDINGDGKLVSIVASWINNTLIRMELSPMPTGQLPFVISKYNPVMDSVFGDSDAELLLDNQKTIGAITRANIDLIAKSANSQQGFATGFVDAINKRKFINGEDYEFNGNMLPTNAIFMHQSPEVSQTSLVLLDQQAKEAEQLTGVITNTDSNQLGNTAGGIRSVLASTDLRKASILRRMISGIIKLAKQVAILNNEFLSEEEEIRITNEKFEKIRREDLKGNFDVSTHISSPEENQKKVQDLTFVLQTASAVLGPELTVMMLADIAYLLGMPELENKFKTYTPPPPSEEEIKLKQLEIRKMEAEVAKIESEVAMNQAKAQEIMAKANQINLDLEETVTGVKDQKEIAKQQAQAKGNQELEITKAIVKGEASPTNIEAGIGFNKLSQAGLI